MTASAFSSVTVGFPQSGNVIAPATQLVENTGQSVLLYNTDTTVTVWLCVDNSYTSNDSGTPNVSPLGPLQSIVFDGSLPVYAVAPLGQSAVINVFPSAINFTPSTPVASLAALNSGVTIPANSSVQVFGGAFTADVTLFASYDLNLAVVDTGQATAGHALSVSCMLNWYDDLVSGLAIFREIWNPWVVSQAVTFQQGVIGSGPMHGKYMSMSISNLSAFPVTLQYCNVFGSNRNQQLSDWRQSLGNHVSDASLHEIQTVDTGYENSLFDTGTQDTLSAATGYLFPLNLYSGPVTISLLNNSATISSAELVDIGTNHETSGNIGTTAGVILPFSNTAAGTNQTATNIDLPRSACAVKLITGATGGGNVGLKVTAQQGP